MGIRRTAYPSSKYPSTCPSLLRRWNQVELDLIAIEVDALCDLKCSPDSLVIVQSDDHAAHPLVVFSDLLLDVPHVSLDLPDHRITGTTTLQFDNKQLLLVLTDGEQIKAKYKCPVGTFILYTIYII